MLYPLGFLSLSISSSRSPFVSPFRGLDIKAMTPSARVSRLHFRQHRRPSKYVGVIYPKRFCCLYDKARLISVSWIIRLPWLTVEERREAERSRRNSTRQVSRFPSTALQNEMQNASILSGDAYAPPNPPSALSSQQSSSVVAVRQLYRCQQCVSERAIGEG